jgi:hypothetical protein
VTKLCTGCRLRRLGLVLEGRGIGLGESIADMVPSRPEGVPGERTAGRVMSKSDKPARVPPSTDTPSSRLSKENREQGEAATGETKGTDNASDANKGGDETRSREESWEARPRQEGKYVSPTEGDGEARARKGPREMRPRENGGEVRSFWGGGEVRPRDRGGKLRLQEGGGELKSREGGGSRCNGSRWGGGKCTGTRATGAKHPTVTPPLHQRTQENDKKHRPGMAEQEWVGTARTHK